MRRTAPAPWAFSTQWRICRITRRKEACCTSLRFPRRAFVSWAAIGCCFLTLIACKRERRDVRPSPAVAGILGDAGGESALYPGGSAPHVEVRNPYEGNAYAISEGQRLFNWYSCSGCHANGGGGIGPPLIKKDQRD